MEVRFKWEGPILRIFLIWVAKCKQNSHTPALIDLFRLSILFPNTDHVTIPRRFCSLKRLRESMNLKKTLSWESSSDLYLENKKVCSNKKRNRSYKKHVRFSRESVHFYTQSVNGEQNKRQYNTNNTPNPDKHGSFTSRGPVKIETHDDSVFLHFRFVGTHKGVLRVFPGTRFQKTYSHKRQPW